MHEKKRRTSVELPSLEQVKNEQKRLRYKGRYRQTLKSTIAILIVVSAIAVLVATLWMPVLQVYGTSMEPTMTEGEIIFTVKTHEFETGDIIAFHYDNKILVKRIVAVSGDWVNIGTDGTVYINDEAINEPYVTEKAFGSANIQFPYQVPDGKFFVMGDHRSTSMDSRNVAVGCVNKEQIISKILFRIWPISRFGTIS